MFKWNWYGCGESPVITSFQHQIERSRHDSHKCRMATIDWNRFEIGRHFQTFPLFQIEHCIWNMCSKWNIILIFHFKVGKTSAFDTRLMHIASCGLIQSCQKKIRTFLLLTIANIQKMYNNYYVRKGFFHSSNGILKGKMLHSKHIRPFSFRFISASEKNDSTVES